MITTYRFTIFFQRHGFTYAKEAGIPEKIDTIEELEHILTCLIFASSVQHAGKHETTCQLKHVRNGIKCRVYIDR